MTGLLSSSVHPRMLSRQAGPLRVFVCGVLLLAPSATAHAQQAGSGRALPVLALPASPRALSFGDAAPILSPSSEAIFTAPALLADLRHVDVGGSLQRWVLGSTLGAMSLAAPAAGGTIALGLRTLAWDGEPELLPGGDGSSGDPSGATVDAGEAALSFAYARAIGFGGRLRAAAGVTFARQRVADVSGDAVAADLGIAWRGPQGLETSASIQQLGSRLAVGASTAPLPRLWRLGAALPVATRGAFIGSLLAEVRQQSGDDQPLATLGTELMRTAREGRPGFALRAAWTSRPESEDRSGLSAGGGVTIKHLTLEYGWQRFDLLGGSTHRLGARWSRPR